MLALSLLAALGCLWWIVCAVLGVWTARALPRLADLDTPEPDPEACDALVTIVIPARDEAHTLPAAMDERLADPDPALRFVLVDDRSQDATGAIMDAAAARDDRVTVLHLDALPAGWLGKSHALHQGARSASAAGSEWLLFTDADVHVRPGAVRRAVRHAERQGVDHLVLFPEVWSRGFLLDAALSTFGKLFVLGLRVWAVANPRSRASVGVGAFNLVRRSAWERTRGFPWLAMEVADDLGVGKLMKQSGARCGVLSGIGLVGLEWYPSLGAMAVGLEKNTFAVLHCSLPRMLAVALSILALEAAPWAALLLPPLAPLGIAALLCGALLHVGIAVHTQRPVLPALLSPLGTVLFAWILVRSGVLGVRRGGIQWRGTFHSIPELRAGRRV